MFLRNDIEFLGLFCCLIQKSIKSLGANHKGFRKISGVIFKKIKETNHLFSSSFPSHYFNFLLSLMSIWLYCDKAFQNKFYIKSVFFFFYSSKILLRSFFRNSLAKELRLVADEDKDIMNKCVQDCPKKGRNEFQHVENFYTHLYLKKKRKRKLYLHVDRKLKKWKKKICLAVVCL